MTDESPLAKALAAFQAELPTLRKDEDAKVKGQTRDGRDYDRSYKYADLAQVVETVLPVLGKHGLSVTSKTAIVNDAMMLQVSLVHESGERETGYWPLPSGPKIGPQDLGSAMTYGRRYLTLALTGTYPGGEDDDGARAQNRADAWETARPREERPVSAPPAQPAAPTDADVLRWVTPMPTADLDQALKVYDWMAGKDLHKRIVQMEYEGTMVPVTATDLIAGRIADEAVTEEATLETIKWLQEQANDRGLMKVEVGDQETLGAALMLAQDQVRRLAADGGTQAELNEQQGS
jgi:hypothetical protein